MSKELRGARACRTLGRDVGAIQEMLSRGILTNAEFEDLKKRLAAELEEMNAAGRLNPHQYEKVLADLALPAGTAPADEAND